MEMDQWPALRWGQMVETLRTLRGWSQEELGAAAAVDKTTIAKQEQGGASQPSVDGRAKIERALGIDGRSREVAIYLGELRARLIGEPERRDPTERFNRVGTGAAGRME